MLRGLQNGQELLPSFGTPKRFFFFFSESCKMPILLHLQRNADGDHFLWKDYCWRKVIEQRRRKTIIVFFLPFRPYHAIWEQGVETDKLSLWCFFCCFDSCFVLFWVSLSCCLEVWFGLFHSRKESKLTENFSNPKSQISNVENQCHLAKKDDILTNSLWIRNFRKL